MDALPNRSWEAIKLKAERLGLERYRKPFDSEMDEDLAYILGVLYGDGWVSKCPKGESPGFNYNIGMEVTSRKFRNQFYDSLEAKRLNPFKYYRKDYGYWGAGAHSAAFYEWFTELNLRDIEKLVSKTEFIKQFIRGFYESEGSLCYTSTKRNYCDSTRRDYYKTCSMTNSSKNLLELVNDFLLKLGIDSSIWPRGDGTFALEIKREDLPEFIEKINPCIKNTPTNEEKVVE